jgi:hypothetical protein
MGYLTHNDEWGSKKGIRYEDKKFEKKLNKYISKLLVWAQQLENKLDSAENVITNAQKYAVARRRATDIVKNIDPLKSSFEGARQCRETEAV